MGVGYRVHTGPILILEVLPIFDRRLKVLILQGAVNISQLPYRQERPT